MTTKTYAERNREANRRYFAKMTDEERKQFYRDRYHRTKSNGRQKVQSKQWRLANPEAAQASSHQTNLKLKHPKAYETSDITVKGLRDWLKERRDTACTYCGNPGVHIDHIVPLSKGGEHTWTNITISCKSCNVSKSDMQLDEWLEHIRQIAAHNNLMN